MKEKDMDFVIAELKKHFSGSVDYMSGVNDALYTVVRKIQNKASDVLLSINQAYVKRNAFPMDGYIHLTKIAEYGLSRKSRSVRNYMLDFIDKYPDHELSKPFAALLQGNMNPDGLSLHETEETT